MNFKSLLLKQGCKYDKYICAYKKYLPIFLLVFLRGAFLLRIVFHFVHIVRYGIIDDAFGLDDFFVLYIFVSKYPSFFSRSRLGTEKLRFLLFFLLTPITEPVSLWYTLKQTSLDKYQQSLIKRQLSLVKCRKLFVKHQ